MNVKNLDFDVSKKKKKKESLRGTWKYSKRQFAQNNEDKRKNSLARDSESTTRDCMNM